MWQRWLIVFVAIVTVGCGGSSPTAPGTPALTTNASLTVARHETSQLHAQFGTLGNASDDVTAAATWTSSDPQVVTVNAGLVTAVGIGHTTITVVYQGQTKVVPVTARRRMAIDGNIRLTNVDGERSLRDMVAWMDDEYVGYLGLSENGDVSGNVVLSYTPVADRAVDPGSHQIAVVVQQPQPPDHLYTSDPSSHIDIVDRDTGKHLATIPLTVQQQILESPAIDYTATNLPAKQKMTWTIQVDTYTS